MTKTKRYPKGVPRGADLSRTVKAKDVPSVDFEKLLSVDTSNPHLRALRIQQGFLKDEDLPTKSNDKKVPKQHHLEKKEKK